jgi:predicted Ser/Thr protein kinase
MQLEKEFIDRWNITEYQIEKQFNSKKNRVYLVRADIEGAGEKRFVLKQYKGRRNSISREADILAELYKRGVGVPELYYRGAKSIAMEYVKGPTLIDVMTDAEYMAGQKFDYINAKGMASHIARWLGNFYKAMEKTTGKGIILWDINLRNFLVGYKLYGIDFEDCREGAYEEDLGRLLAFIVTYAPAFTPYKIEFAKEVYNALGRRLALDRDRVMVEMLKEFDAIRERRGMEIPEEIVGRIIPVDLFP